LEKRALNVSNDDDDDDDGEGFFLFLQFACSDLMQFSCTAVSPRISEIDDHFSYCLYFLNFFKTLGTLSRVLQNEKYNSDVIIWYQ